MCGKTAHADMGTARVTIINIGTLSMNKFWNETERVRSATATCTLIEVGDQRLLVDPSPEPDLLEPMLFDRSGLGPEHINQIFLTHFHGDHRYGLDLFTGKPWLMASAGLKDWKQRSPNDAELIGPFLPAEEHLSSDISVFPSAGHTMGHCSLLVKTKWGSLIVAGDAVMTEDFFGAEEGFHNSVNFEQATETIQKIKEATDLVIPGHGNFILNYKRRLM